MLGFRQPTTRDERREWWRRQLSRQQSANLSVTEFCRQLGVSVTTFYYWKKRVHEAPANTLGRVLGNCSSRRMTTTAGATAANLIGPGAAAREGDGSTVRLRSRTTRAFLFRCFWIPRDAEPDAGAPAFEAARQVLVQPLGLACFQIVVPEYDFKSIVERQERSEHVDLIQRESPFEPFLRILEREMDVMDVDEHSRGKGAGAPRRSAS